MGLLMRWKNGLKQVCSSQPYKFRVWRRPIETAPVQQRSVQRLMADHGVVCSISYSSNVWDNAAMESFFSSLKTGRTAATKYRSTGRIRLSRCHPNRVQAS
jgi:transposase InsO family protein